MTVESVENVSKTQEVPVQEKETVNNAAAKPTVSAPSPAQDLRDIQQLLVAGVFQGNMAPAVIRAFQFLEKMAVQIETASKETV